MENTMADRNLRDFEARLHKIEEIHHAGGAFEAAGTLGRSYFDSVRTRTRREIPLRAMAMILGGVLLFKSSMLAAIGTENYSLRMERLQAGGIAEQSAAWVMTPDFATVSIAQIMRPLFY